MSTSNYSAILNISIPVRDFPKSITFYATVFEVLGIESGILVKPQHDEEAALSFRWGNAHGPSFTVVKKRQAMRPTAISLTLRAPTERAVDWFFNAAMESGATSDLAPAPVQLNGLAGYMCSVFDFDGNELKALYAEPYVEVKDVRGAMEIKEVRKADEVHKTQEVKVVEVTKKAKEAEKVTEVKKGKESKPLTIDVKKAENPTA